MSFDSFVEGPLLWAAFLVFVAGVLCRGGLWLQILLRKPKSDDFRLWYPLLPYHKALAKRPLSGSVAYAFHTGMVIVAVFYSGHILMWEQSRFGWSWSAIPDELTDWMTVSLLALTVFFLARRALSRKSRTNSSLSDFSLILIASLPFLTGYFLAHGNLDSVPFIGENMWTLHILSAEILLVAGAFLFCGVRLNVETCTGCASCELGCPTVALAHTDEGNRRVFRYVLAQCIYCAGCVGTCPEEAAELRHEMGISKLSRQFHWNPIRSVELEACLGCGSLFAPAPQLNSLNQTVADNYLRYCSRCKKLTFSRIVFPPADRGVRKDS